MNTHVAAIDRLAACAREPIHPPGAIQPHGVLLCFDQPQLQLVQASANLADLLQQPVETLLGQHIDGVLGPGHALLLGRTLASSELEARPLYLGMLQVAGRGFDAVVHRRDRLLLLELEAAQQQAQSFGAIYPLVRSFVAQLQHAGSAQELCALAVRELRRMTGFGRVLAYRFTDDGHGHVLAEDRAAQYASYLDLYFPDSDIPAQARALYLANHLRLIADAEYRPSPLVPALNPLTGQPTDLSYASLRSASPVHVEYLKNMGTRASMSISIVVGGRLWGLISCHDAEPRSVPFALRTACEHVGQILSLQIEAKEDRSETAHRLELRSTLVRLLAAMTDRDRLVEGLVANADDLLGFANAAGAAVVFGGRCTRLGDAPSEAALLQLADWLSQQPTDGVFHTTRLDRDYPDAASLRPQVAGLLAASISQIHRDYVLWFRPEVVRTVKWAGNPEQPPLLADADGRAQLQPRNRFETWVQTVRGSSAPWRPSEIDAAQEFRAAILAIVLKHAEEVAQLAGDLERSNKELEAFSYSVSHDLRAPLRHIVGYADLLKEFEGAQLSERGNRFLQHIGESAQFAGTLVDDLLTFSQMGRSALRLVRVDLAEAVKAVVADLRRELDGRSVEWQIGPLPEVSADALFLRLALRNLLSNAVKYTRTRSPARIVIRAERADREHIVHVQDNGVGFNMKYAGKLFGVFQRLHRMEDFEGTGIGLANVRRIIERHGGRVWAVGESDRGATFSFALPDRFPSP